MYRKALSICQAIARKFPNVYTCTHAAVLKDATMNTFAVATVAAPDTETPPLLVLAPMFRRAVTSPTNCEQSASCLGGGSFNTNHWCVVYVVLDLKATLLAPSHSGPVFKKSSKRLMGTTHRGTRRFIRINVSSATRTTPRAQQDRNAG